MLLAFAMPYFGGVGFSDCGGGGGTFGVAFLESVVESSVSLTCFRGGGNAFGALEAWKVS